MNWWIKITVCNICDCLTHQTLEHMLAYIDTSKILITDCKICQQPNSKLVLNVKMED